MCGICGFLEPSPCPLPEMRQAIDGMCHTLRHRGPDGQGVFLDNDPPVALGHQRLSIIDITGGQQPMANEDQTIHIVFNGEIYNYQEIRHLLQNKGHVFTTSSDTETIVHAYEEWGHTCLHHLRGMFSFTIWDSGNQRLFCARDRVGIKPFYYFWDGYRFAFSSEIKALLAHPEIVPELDNEALVNYLRLLYIPAPQTIYRNIYKLPPGHFLLLENGRLSTAPYWDLHHAIRQQRRLTLREASKQLRDTLQEAVDIRLISEVPLGAFLSGGVDSSIVVALMSQTTGGGVMSHTEGFTDKDYDESGHPRTIAQQFRCDHSEITMKPDVRHILPKLIWHMDEPFADASMIPTYFLCQAARKRVTVCLSGDGGDELFAGYNWYAELQKLQKLNRLMPPAVRAGLALPGNMIPETIRGTTFLRNLASDWSKRHINLIGGFTDQQIGRLTGHDPSASNRQYIHPLSMLYQEQALAEDPVLNAQYIDFQSYMVDDILMKVDKMSMAHSLEVRVPLLDHKFVELAFSLATDLKIKGSERKIALKECVSDIIPRDFFARRKQGFSIPLKCWLQNELQDYVHEYLLSPSSHTGHFLDMTEVKNIWDTMNNKTMRIDLSPHVWALLCLELWARTFVNASKGQQPMTTL